VPGLFHNFLVKARPERIFEAVSTPAGLDAWWTKTSQGSAAAGAEYLLNFGPGYDWKAVVTRCAPPHEFELQLTSANGNEVWQGTRVGFVIQPGEKHTGVHFHHAAWPDDVENFRVSNYCWAMYLRIMKRHVEHGEFVPFENRLDV
jgi:uncharacterized protein YndB with AHSA1/START domain